MTTPFSTPLCELLAIQHPILQSGMGHVAGPELVAEVCNAGGLGILAGLGVEPGELRQRIQAVRRLTDRPFGVNLWLHTDLYPPLDFDSVPEVRVAEVQGALNRSRRALGLPESFQRPAPPPAYVEGAIEVILEEAVAVFSVGLGNPEAALVQRCHQRGIRVMAMVASVQDARAVAAHGVDLIVAQGSEAGGHRSTWKKPARWEEVNVGTVALVPQIVDAVAVPVIASGGLADGRGLVAALALGAAGILLGTRFVATREATVPSVWKRALLEREGDATTVTDAFSGYHARALDSAFVADYRASGAGVLPALAQSAAARDIYDAARATGNGDYFPMWSGQSVGLIHDLPGAGDVVRQIVHEAEQVMARLRAVGPPAPPH